MLTWIPYTFVRFTLFFASGILLGIFYPDLASEQWLLVAALFLTIGYTAIVFLRNSFSSAVNPGLVGLPLMILAGYIVVHIRTESNQPTHIINERDTVGYYAVEIISYPEERTNSWKQVGEVVAIKTDVEFKQRRGKVLLYFDNDDFREPFPYGSVLLVKGAPQLVSGPGNPHEFDYKKYLSFQNIYHQQMIKGGDAIMIRNDPESKIVELTLWARKKSTDIIKSNVTGAREQAIALALVLGVTDNLDDELLGAYASSGAIHVLAVSGLHIGILYAVITFVFGPLRRYSRGKWVLAGVSLLCLWSYAFITGMSPSVLRAVTMFTFVSLAEVSNRRSNIYNTLALSAFCLLLYDPYFIMSVGFQLSYLAVLGIVYLYPRLIFLWTPPSWLIPAWKITCVSVSAQLATFPLGLLYFHQFPVYFLVSNLFVIPLSFLVLVLGLIVLALNVFAPVVKPLGVLLTYVIKAMNAGVLFTEQLPGSLIKGIHITTLQYWFLFGFVVTVLLIFRLRKYKILYASLALAICFSIIQWKHFLKKKKALIVYNVRGHFAMDIFDNGRAYHFADSVLLEDPQRLSFQVNGNRVANAIYSIQSGDQLPFVRNLPGCRLVRWENLSMIQITDKQFTFTRKIPVDYVVISRNAVNSLDQIREKVDCREVIVDSSNSWWVAANLIHEAEEKHQGLYSVLHQGALVKEL